jgi:hypothetical protein
MRIVVCRSRRPRHGFSRYHRSAPGNTVPGSAVERFSAEEKGPHKRGIVSWTGKQAGDARTQAHDRQPVSTPSSGALVATPSHGNEVVHLHVLQARRS